MAEDRRHESGDEEPDKRTSPYWDDVRAEDITAGDGWFNELHSLVDRCFRGLGVATGIEVQDKGCEISIPGDRGGPDFELRQELLEGCEFAGHPLRSVAMRRFAREPKRRGMELVRLVFVWSMPDTEGVTRHVTRTVRMTCSPRLNTRELSVDVPDYRDLRDLRWSAYFGFVDLDPDTLQYRIPVEPEMDSEALSLIEHGCAKTLIQSIPVMQQLADRCGGLVVDETFSATLKRLLHEI